MNQSIVVDTDIVIDFLRGNRVATEFLRSIADRMCFSAVTVAEVYAGVRGRNEESEVERLFSVFPVVAATGEIAREAGKLVQKYRLSHAVNLPDALVAATCLINGANLCTLNVKHYPMMKGLKAAYVKKGAA